VLDYWRFETGRLAGEYKPRKDRNLKMANRIFSLMPDGLLAVAGDVLYRHFG
jgi:hypothetical protein